MADPHDDSRSESPGADTTGDAATTPLDPEESASSPDEALARNANLSNIVFAVLFAAEEPVSIRKLSAIVEDATADDVREAVESWRRRFDEEAWSVRVESVAGGYQIATRPDFAPYISRLYSGRRKFRLSRAGLETLAIIAYKQPVTRAEIENIRGVGCGGVITNLMERSLIKITGKARVLGAPFLYGTTPELLEYLGLDSLSELPSLEELESLLEKEAYPESAVESDGGQTEEAGEGEAPAQPEVPADLEVGEDFESAVAAFEAAKKTVHGLVKKEAPTSAPPAEGAPEAAEAPAAATVATASDEELLKQGAAAGPESEIPTIDFAREPGDDTTAGSDGGGGDGDESGEDDDGER